MNLKALMGSDRPGHLFAATATGLVLIVSAIAYRQPWWVGVGATVILWEWLATPDVDYAEKRKPLNKVRNALRAGSPIKFLASLLWTLICWAWLPYGWLVPHRDKYSHSLAYGLPCRLAYVVTVLLLIGWLRYPPLVDWLAGDALSLLLGGDSLAWLLRGFSLLSSAPLESTWAILKGLLLLPADLWAVVILVGDRWSMLLMGAAIGDVVHLCKDNYSLKRMVFGR